MYWNLDLIVPIQYPLPDLAANPFGNKEIMTRDTLLRRLLLCYPAAA